MRATLLERIQLTFYLLDKDGRVIFEDAHNPISVFNGGPLKPNYSRVYRGVISKIPSDYAGTTEVKVTDVEFAE